MARFAAKCIVRFFTAILFFMPVLSLADSGTFKATAVYTHSYITLDRTGTGYTGGWLEGYTVINESTGPLFESGEVMSIMCIVYSQGKMDSLEIMAPCEWTKSNGDALVTMSSRNDSGMSEGQTGDGIMKFLSGTGELQDIGGSCLYSATYLPDSTAISNLRCEWERN